MWFLFLILVSSFQFLVSPPPLFATDEIIYIRGGNYGTFTPSKSGTPSQYVIYQNTSGEKVTYTSASLSGVSYIKLVGLNFANSSGSGINITNNSHHIVIDGVTVTNSGSHGIMLDGKNNTISNIEIKNSSITTSKNHGINVYEKVTDTTIGPNNHIYNNGFRGGYSFGIDISTVYPGEKANGAERIRIIGNEINNNDIQGMRTWNSSYILIQDNHIHHNGASGIQIENGSDHIVISHNISEYNAQTWEYETGFWVDDSEYVIGQDNTLRGNKIGIMITSSRNVIVRRNVSYENNRGVATDGTTPNTVNAMGAIINNDTQNGVFVHNTLYRNGTSSSSKGGLSFCSKAQTSTIISLNNVISESTANNDLWTACSQVNSDYNNFFNTRNLKLVFNGTTYTSLSTYQKTGQDSHSLSQNPLFTNPSGGYFTFQANSPLLNAGTPLTTTTNSGTGSNLIVKNANFFSDGMGLIVGDPIQVGQYTANITKINYSTNTLTLDRSLAWSAGQPVSYPYSGSNPDIGAFESGSTIVSTPKPITQPTTQPSTIDATGDTKVDLLDFNRWKQEYLGQLTTKTADFDKSGTVNLLDFNTWKKAYLGT